MYVLHVDTLMTMGYSIESLDICFGNQLADSQDDTGVIWAHRLIHIFVLYSPIETLGSLCSSLCGLSIMNMNMLWCYSSRKSRIDQIEKIALRYFSMNSIAICDTYRDGSID